jgi:hypothetical protein
VKSLAGVMIPKTLPFPLARKVMIVPLTVAAAFQAEENRCGDVNATTTVRLLVPLMVISALNRSAYLGPSRNVVQPPRDGLTGGEALGDGLTGGVSPPGTDSSALHQTAAILL